MGNLHLLKKHNFRFNKNFGQNFIFDQNLLRAIVSDAGVTSNSHVVEVGVGSAMLTKELGLAAKDVTAFEIDNNLKEIIAETLQDQDNINVVFKDFMQVDLTELEQQIGKPYIVVANLPYYITTPIIFKLLEEGKNVQSLTLMMQKEVADRLVAPSNTKDYGRLSVALGAIADVKLMRNVSRKMFTPEPNVDSAVVKITLNRNKFDIKEYKTFNNVVKLAFAMRRKTLMNNLKALNLASEQLIQIFETLKLPLTIRGESLSPAQFVDLGNFVFELQQN